ncbi:hypothetical protein DFQ14_11519 [Halopolyspora algeriensis]|uniref:Metal-sulfur cluster biosynthetic enzyme n=1 Tax=Halopolyspora algeriensis TaxID=1500506 RepID=A0A368VG66_9ACTN|nr:hypothetical protein [Halopolyspora algeriensis]RCW39643.1 hypothetical protein DFQ14_11519 [Halopolyspora algeriensis]TQM54064.1 hypothetical protein FHU43_2242 [Halopolyspora algeriensis]
METRVHTPLLDEVWEVLDGIRPPGEEHTLTELGLVTAVSTNGAVMRVLLRVPTALCWVPGGGELLAELEKSIRNVPSLSTVELYAKPSWPAWSAADPNHARKTSFEYPLGPELLSQHSTCVESALTEPRRDGWMIDGLRQQFCAQFRATEDRPDKVRVIIRARIRPETNPLEAA